MNELKRNGSGYTDPTAYSTMKNFVGGVTNMEVYRGDIFFVTGYKAEKDSEQKRDRPAVVVSNEKANKFSPVIEVVFLTSAEKARWLPTHVDVMCQIPSVPLCEQITSISKSRLGDFVRSCTDEEMNKIDEALMVSLGLTEQPKEQKEQVVATAGMIDDLKMKLKEIYNKKMELEAVIELLKSENERLKIKEPVNNPDEFIKLETERNLYKSLYEQTFERLIG